MSPSHPQHDACQPGLPSRVSTALITMLCTHACPPFRRRRRRPSWGHPPSFCHTCMRHMSPTVSIITMPLWCLCDRPAAAILLPRAVSKPFAHITPYISIHFLFAYSVLIATLNLVFISCRRGPLFPAHPYLRNLHPFSSHLRSTRYRSLLNLANRVKTLILRALRFALLVIHTPRSVSLSPIHNDCSTALLFRCLRFRFLLETH